MNCIFHRVVGDEQLVNGNATSVSAFATDIAAYRFPQLDLAGVIVTDEFAEGLVAVKFRELV